MAKIQLNRVTNANIYADGDNWIGRAEELKLPTLMTKLVDHKALGLVGTLELPSGIDKLEGEIKWNSFYPEVFKKIANPFQPIQLQARSNLQTFANGGLVQEVPVVTYVTALFSELDLGDFKQHENVEINSKFKAYYLRQVINGEDIVEIDVMANLFKVAGQDLLATYRVNIGG